MTTTTNTRYRKPGLFGAIWNWLQRLKRGAKSAPELTTLSDRTLRDIGIERDELRRLGIRTEHDAMRYSG
ncbi:DUF1127 domain-containing protein [Tabrizicola sp.]|uniref:DUF1127 domain-containing protein n=1 Tax=Tabrizicola sp. TaxID=2005166 RepID=UPI003F2D5E19